MSFVQKAVGVVVGVVLIGLLGRGKNPEPIRLGEISQQTAKEGEARVIVWGRVRPIGGNIIHCQTPVKRMVKQKVDGGGKGGSKKKTQKVEHVFRTYAIGVCEGPISGFVRIWRNNKLVYDARGNDWGDKNNPVFLKSFRLYTGAWDQLPDPALEKVWGVGNVPAYRGTAYMVAVDEDLTDLQGMVPQWQFEVERAEGTYLTSRPYNVESIESLDVSTSLDAARFRAAVLDGYGIESMNLSGTSLDSIVFRNVNNEFTAPTESLESGASLDSIDWSKQSTPEVDINAGMESLDIQGASLDSVKYRIAVVPYNNAQPEILDVGAELTGVNWYAP